MNEFISNPYSIPVSFKICQKPCAPAGEITLESPLSATAKYLKSSGMLFFFRIGSIIGKYLLALFMSKIP